MALIIDTSPRERGIYVCLDANGDAQMRVQGTRPKGLPPDCIVRFDTDDELYAAYPELIQIEAVAMNRARHKLQYGTAPLDPVYALKLEDAVRIQAGDTTNLKILDQEAAVRGVTVQELATAVLAHVTPEAQLVADELARVAASLALPK